MPKEREKKNMKKSVFASVCVLLLAAVVLFSAVPARAEAPFGCSILYVSTGNAGRLHLRAMPSTDSRSLGLYRNGTQVRVMSRLGLWAYVNVNGATGYMMTRYLAAFASQSEPNPYATVRYVRTGNSGRLHLREHASRDARSLGLYFNGTQVDVIANYGTWSFVNVNGKAGYMMSVYLASAPPALITPALTATPAPAPFSILTVRQPNDSFVYLRSTSTSNSNTNVICKVPSGSRVTLLEWGEWWSRVCYNGVEGYMVSHYLKQQ